MVHIVVALDAYSLMWFEHWSQDRESPSDCEAEQRSLQPKAVAALPTGRAMEDAGPQDSSNIGRGCPEQRIPLSRQDRLLDHDEDVPMPSLPKPTHLARTAKHHRRKICPEQPKDLDFELNPEYAPSTFVRANLKIEEGRYIVMATDSQLQLLQDCIKLVQDPYYQLISIHSFVCSGDFCKQVPLIFCLMSGKTTLCPEALPRRTEGEEGDCGFRDLAVEGHGEEAIRRQYQYMRLPFGASSMAAHLRSWTWEDLYQ